MKRALEKLLGTPHNRQIDTYKAIFLNIIPPEDNDTHTVKLHILSLYRHTAWQVRLQTTFCNTHHTPTTILNMYTHKLTHALTKQGQWATFERMTS